MCLGMDCTYVTVVLQYLPEGPKLANWPNLSPDAVFNSTQTVYVLQRHRRPRWRKKNSDRQWGGGLLDQHTLTNHITATTIGTITLVGRLVL